MIGAGDLASALGLPAPTPAQVRVIEAPLSPALVVAGAGSGKTETMAARVVYLVANGLVRPEQVLGLTFTRKAAGQLATRIRQRLRALLDTGLLVQPIQAAVLGGEPEVSTYHAFAGRLIGEFGPLVGVEPGARVLTETGAWQLARRVVTRWDGDLATDLGPDVVTERLLQISGALADHLLDAGALEAELDRLLSELVQAPPAPRQRRALHSRLEPRVRQLRDRMFITPLVGALTAAKRDSDAIDFADQMQLAARLVLDHPRIGSALRDRFTVVMLDEYQDTGHAQRVILSALFGAGVAPVGDRGRRAGHAVTAVGDPVQSIYSWRGASASNLRRFGTDFPAADGGPAPTLPMLTSFRNPVRVLAVANALSAPIRSAPVPVGELGPRPGAGDGVVRSAVLPTMVDEIDWLATAIAQYWDEAAQAGSAPPSTAVLMRRRKDMGLVAQVLRERGLPVEVGGLGGLLAEPEIADLVALLRVLVDTSAGSAAIRLLTGARWRLGAADLAALARRARMLAGVRPRPDGQGLAAVRAALAETRIAPQDGELATLVDAIHDPGTPGGYSVPGYERITRFGAELTRLRRRIDQPLPDLIADLEHATLLDVEVQLASPVGRAHLEAFADVVTEVAAAGVGASGLLEYLDAALDREEGLEPGEVAPVPGAVQVLTVHAAKGLEFEVVAVPQLCDGIFPSNRTLTWLSDSGELPPSLRGDSADFPALSLPAGGDQADMARALDEHRDALAGVKRAEERRLAYVAVTRAERVLLVSAHRWGDVGKPREVSPYLDEIVAATERFAPPEVWAEPPGEGEENPLTATPRSAPWPVDPLGGRRDAVRAGADAVLDLLAAGDGLRTDIAPDRPGGWSADAAVLLAERHAADTATVDVRLPSGLSVSTLVDIARDPQQLARRLRRPLPAEPAPLARRGTAFHRWLEHFYGGGALLEIEDLPGAGDAGAAADERLEELKRQFLRSAWASRVPAEIELPFVTQVGGVMLRGRIDAVFADDDGGYTVVDWKTGAPPGPADRSSVAVQLACYRLAVAAIEQVPIQDVRACFHYVATNETLAPADPLDARGLAALIAAAEPGDARGPDAATVP